MNLRLHHKSGRSPGNTRSAGLPAGASAAVQEALRSPGRPLDAATRAFMEPRFGHDFSRVRVHTDIPAADSARAVNSLAYTVGQSVVFGQSHYQPATDRGRKLLAHELVHVLQQGNMQIKPVMPLSIDSPAGPMEQEAHRVADAVMLMPARDRVDQFFSGAGRGFGAVQLQPIRQKIPAAIVQRFSTQDCDREDVTRIEESHNRATAIVEAAISRLTANPVTAETQRHFSNHFGGYGAWRRDIVLGHFRRDLNLLRASEMTYQCESECDEGEPAYTYWVFGDIHICLPWLRSQVLTERGETFIHEMHHWDATRGHLDLGYHKNNEDSRTTWVVAVNNADAYSELAQDLYEQP